MDLSSTFKAWFVIEDACCAYKGSPSGEGISELHVITALRLVVGWRMI